MQILHPMLWGILHLFEVLCTSLLRSNISFLRSNIFLLSYAVSFIVCVVVVPKSRVNSPNRGTRRSRPNHDAVNSTSRNLQDIGKRVTRCIKWCFFFLHHVQLISSPSPQMALFSFFTSVCLLSVLARAGFPFSLRFYLTSCVCVKLTLCFSFLYVQDFVDNSEGISQSSEKNVREITSGV